MVPASVMNPIIKLWPFRGWGMDIVGGNLKPGGGKHPSNPS
jgi:hypothetical protein